MSGRTARSILTILAALVLSACAGRETVPDPPATTIGLPPDLECKAPVAEPGPNKLLDTTQVRIEQIVYTSSRWFDGLFGVSDVECAGNVSRGYIGAGLRWDERDGTRFRGRLRAKVALPALDRRARLVIGRGDADRIIDGSEDENFETIPERFEEFDDQEFLLGLGYSRGGALRRGWDFGLGIKVSTPVDPYTRARYFWNPVVADRWLWRMVPQLFWQDSRGFGASLTNTVDVAVGERWMWRSWTSLVEDEESEGLEWASRLTAYQNLSDRSAFAYSVFANGETEAEVPLTDYGVEVRFRRSVLREWFFVELLTSVSWPQEFEIETRETNIGVGVEFEMQFGDWPNRR